MTSSGFAQGVQRGQRPYPGPQVGRRRQHLLQDRPGVQGRPRHQLWRARSGQASGGHLPCDLQRHSDADGDGRHGQDQLPTRRSTKRQRSRWLTGSRLSGRRCPRCCGENESQVRDQAARAGHLAGGHFSAGLHDLPVGLRDWFELHELPLGLQGVEGDRTPELPAFPAVGAPGPDTTRNTGIFPSTSASFSRSPLVC